MAGEGSGSFSCQLILGRSLLADEDSTIPKNELEALTMGSNLGWILRQTLEKWVDSYIVISDSTIALCWVTSEKKRLSLFHRNRCVQIKRGTDLDLLYHVATEFNPSDTGTRPHLVKISDVGPNSAWEKGLPWMKGEIDDAVEEGILTPVSKLRVTDEDEDSYKKGFVFEKSPEILTKGHAVMLASTRVEKVKERQEYSNYLIPPNKFKFEKLVRVFSIVRKFLQKCSKGKLFRNVDTQFQMFPVVNVMHNNLYSVGVKKPGIQFKGKHFVELDDNDISWTLEYLFLKGSEEVKKFCNPDFIKKIAVEKNKILYMKNRILDVERFKVAGGLENLDPLGEFGIKTMIPVQILPTHLLYRRLRTQSTCKARWL